MNFVNLNERACPLCRSRCTFWRERLIRKQPRNTFVDSQKTCFCQVRCGCVLGTMTRKQMCLGREIHVTGPPTTITHNNDNTDDSRCSLVLSLPLIVDNTVCKVNDANDADRMAGTGASDSVFKYSVPPFYSVPRKLLLIRDTSV